MQATAAEPQRQSRPEAVSQAQVSLAHARLMHWITEFYARQGGWPRQAQLHAAAECDPAILAQLQAWGWVAPDADGHWQALEQWISLPVVGTVAGGSPIEAIEHSHGQLSLPLSLFRQRPTYLLRVRGDSMKDAGIHDGDLIAVRKTSQAEAGKIIVARVDNEVTVKRLQLNRDQVALMPENPDHQPIMVAPEDLVVEGVFVGVIRDRAPLH
ncbi:MAG: transcriptional repressor LexA [Pseudomonadota bacterium]|nr:transcriptional repressor LexA [Pseudomonadota bacterium]